MYGTGTAINAYTSGTRACIVVLTSNSDAFTYYLEGGDPLDFPNTTAVSHDGDTLEIGGDSYTLGRYDVWLAATELTAV